MRGPRGWEVGEEAEAAFELWRGKAVEVMLVLFGFASLPLIVAWLTGYDLPATWQWLAVMGTLLVLITAGIAGRRWSPTVRVWLLLSVSYLAAVQGLVWYTGAMARLWLLGAPIAALVIAGRGSAAVAAILSTALVILHAVGALTGVTQAWQVPGFDESQPAVIVSRSVMWVAYFVPLMVLLLNAHFFQLRTLAAERATLARLEEEVVQRRAAHESLARASAERERLAGEIGRVGDEERCRLGQDLHDGVGQQLAVALLRCTALEERLTVDHPAAVAEVRDLQALLESTMDEVHQVARSLSPLDMDPETLGTALGALARRTTTRFGVRCDYRETGTARLPDWARTLDLYRIAQEAVTNAGRHAHAGRITVTLGVEDGEVMLTVEDDGSGLPVQAPRRGLGLQMMAFRADRIGGDLVLEPRPEGGTRVVCRVPEAVGV
jgi:signal transduction histidine kinase